ncbi:WD40-repeat-containing domain protein [Gilbertella persicaria]|uniref:WD40-repeat-containing domain protein n=1 Tax=Gilbertella persicaria TaxID=101096 RepID=UPI0022209BAD|nr:WD40-repeat-containing domain protein [Gilbertella persicaria]KAI8075368.1 WD40-repeat-containing domain protein [Gilbertella persicaria]
MSVYNHRPMVPAPQSRVVEMLESIRGEFDQLAQELYLCKSQRDDFEHKMNQQISEMNSFQQSLLELERTQQNQKKHYEDEIARLRQQIEARGGNASHPGIPLPGHPQQQPPHPQQPPHTQQQAHQPPPPNIGPGSNYFGGIMNAHGNQAPPGLVAPPQMSDQSPNGPPLPPHGAYPPSQPPPPSSSGTPAGYSQPPPPSNPGYAQSPRGMPTPPTSAHPQQPQRQQEWPNGYNYPSRPGSAAPPPQQQQQPPQGNNESPSLKRKSASSVPTPPQNINTASSAMVPRTKSMASPSNAHQQQQSGLADVDPESVPPNMKVEGQDWFALFNPKTNRQLKVDLVHTLDHASVVCCVKFSADGRYLAAGCNRATFIYDVATSQRVAVLQDDNIKMEGDLYIRSVCFSPDGNYLATGAEDKQIRIWDIQKKRIINILVGHQQDIYSLDFSRDGRLIASGSGDCTARIWSMADGKCLHVLRITDHDQKDPGVTSVAFSPDGRIIAAASLDKMVRIWDTQSGVLFERLEGHKDSVYSVVFMPDGKMLVSGSLDKTLKLWQLGTNEGRGIGMDRDRSKGPCKMTFTGHKDFVLSVGCTPDGRWVVSGSKDRGVQFWDPRTGQTQFMLQGHKNSGTLLCEI